MEVPMEAPIDDGTGSEGPSVVPEAPEAPPTCPADSSSSGPILSPLDWLLAPTADEGVTTTTVDLRFALFTRKTAACDACPFELNSDLTDVYVSAKCKLAAAALLCGEYGVQAPGVEGNLHMHLLPPPSQATELQCRQILLSDDAAAEKFIVDYFSTVCFPFPWKKNAGVPMPNAPAYGLHRSAGKMCAGCAGGELPGVAGCLEVSAG